MFFLFDLIFAKVINFKNKYFCHYLIFAFNLFAFFLKLLICEVYDEETMLFKTAKYCFEQLKNLKSKIRLVQDAFLSLICSE